LKRIVISSLIVLVNIVIQSTIFPYIRIYDIQPNSMLIIVVIYGILRGDVEGGIFGFFSGLLVDVFFAKYIGLNALLGMLVGYFCGKPFRDFNYENYILPVVSVAVATLLYNFAFYFINYFFKGELDYVYYLYKIILPETIYNVVLCVPLYTLIFFINQKLEDYEKRNGLF